jgi:hypothetical protein
MSYYFFVGSMMLPVPPPKMSVKINGKNKTLNLINEGEINIIKTPGLTEVSFDAQLPNSQYPFANYDTSLSDSLMDSLSTRLLGDRNSFAFKDASSFLDSFEATKKDKLPIQLVISRMLPDFTMLWDTNLLVTLESYEVKESAEEGFDAIVPLKFRQYRPYGTKTCKVTTGSDGTQHITINETRSSPNKTIPYDYKVAGEQSVWEAVKGASGGKLNWRTIMNLNGVTNPCQTGLKGMVLHFG